MSENHYESLTPKENEDSRGIQNNQNEMTIDYYDKVSLKYTCIPIGLFILVGAIVFSYIIFFSSDDLYTKFFLSIFFLISIIAYFSFLFLKPKQLKIIKNESYNLLTVKITNFLCCTKTTLNFNLQNSFFNIINNCPLLDEQTLSEGLLITNSYNNDTNIDLNLSNIKNKPIKNIYYLFTDIFLYEETKMSLKNFLNTSPEIENPANFDINKYMGKSSDKSPKINISFSCLKVNKFMKMSDYYFSYNFERPGCYCRNLNGFMCIIITIPATILLVLLFTLNLFYQETKVLGISMISVILAISLIIIITNIIIIINYSSRIDIIYSLKFDTIFIALVNHNGTSYKKTYLHDINSIERFTLVSYKDSNEKYFLKVVYKDKTIEDIMRINDNKNDLDGLLFILNERITNSQQV